MYGDHKFNSGAELSFKLRRLGRLCFQPLSSTCLPAIILGGIAVFVAGDTVCFGQTNMIHSGNWFETLNWNNGTPNSSMSATILGVTADVESTGAVANFLFVQGGTVNVHGDGVFAGSATVATTQEVYVGYVSNGNMDLDLGGSVFSNGAYIGFGEGYSGVVSINGSAGSRWQNAGNMSVGAYGLGASMGSVLLTNGAVLENTGLGGTGITVGSGLATGIISVDDSSLISSNLLSVGHGGTGTLNIQNNSTVSDRTGVLGYGAGNTSDFTNSVGTANISDSSWHHNGEFDVGWYAVGNLNANSALITAVNSNVGYASSSVGTANLNSSVWLNTGALNIGESGKGTMNLLNGSLVTDSFGLIGAREGADGKVVVDHSTWNNSSVLSVANGLAGFPTLTTTGTMDIVNGGTVTCQYGIVGNSVLTNGTVLVSGINADNTRSSWAVDTELTIGNGGTGQLTIESDGVVSSQVTYLGYQATGIGKLYLNGTAGSRGSLVTGQINNGTGAGPGGSTIKFDGGVLQATQHQSDFIRNFAVAGVILDTNGGFIDSNGFNIGITTDLQGPGGLTKLGLGTLDLSGVNLYAGDTVVAEGKLVINGSIAGNATIMSGAILGGTGTIGGTITIESGGLLAPGNSPGTITASSLVWNPGGTLEFELGATSDLLELSGALLKGAGAGDFTFNLLDNGMVIGQTYDLIHFSNTNFNSHDFRFTGTGIPAGIFLMSGNKLQFSIVSVPESGALALLSVFGVCIFVRRSRTRVQT